MFKRKLAANLYIFVYIQKISAKWKIKKKVFFRFYILCENFSKIGPIIKKIPNFVNDPLNVIWKFSFSLTFYGPISFFRRFSGNNLR